MRKLLPIFAIFLSLRIIGTAQPKHADRVSHSSTLLVDSSKPYAYLEVDHIGPREPRREGEPKEGIWLRLHNNCTVPLIVRTFGVPPNSPAAEIGVLDNVVANPPPNTGDGGASFEKWPTEMSTSPLAANLGGSTGQTPSSAATSSKLSQMGDMAVIPNGYMFPTSSFVTVNPGQIIYFSVPRNQVGPKWHVEIPFRFDLKVRSPIRSAYNFVSLYEEDVAAKVKGSREMR